MTNSIKIALLSPYHGGSHRAWANGLKEESRHEIELFSLPARFWKWRMHGGAMTLARRFQQGSNKADLILATDMLDLTTFLALTRVQTNRTPVGLYMHENQLTYPLPVDGATGPMRRQHGERDLHYVFINFASMLAADFVMFNSQYHLESWFTALPAFLRHFPEYQELNTVASLRAKSLVVPVGLQLADLQQSPEENLPLREAPLVLWNQRWEYDKNPDDFFGALFELANEGVAFEVALCGEQFGKRPSIFQQAINKLGERIIHVGHAARAHYRSLLWAADLTISTAHHEFFGISILEAIACQTFPLLPNRLSYPELIPSAFHSSCLYEDREDLVHRLRHALTHRLESEKIARALSTAVTPYDWRNLAPRYDEIFEHMAGSSFRRPARIDV